MVRYRSLYTLRDCGKWAINYCPKLEASWDRCRKEIIFLNVLIFEEIIFLTVLIFEDLKIYTKNVCINLYGVNERLIFD